jgi:predicted RNA-binding Zn-ribbon protein involved in translation (DUF1610 family)
MSRPVASCPNCGAPVEFRWSSAVQTVCPNCRSVLVRHDVDLRKVGEVADLPTDVSPIQIGTAGRFEGDPFVVTGRIVYEYAQGNWNEWHLEFGDCSSGWLSDAQLNYAVSRQIADPGPLPESSALTTGQRYSFSRIPFTVATLTRARYRGVDGELPFEYWDKDEVLFADLASVDAHFATLDCSETPPLLFVGVFVDFDDLALSNLKPAPTGPETKAAGFNCRNCGAAIELRAVALTKTVACTSCGAIQNPADPNLLILQEVEKRQKVAPTIPLGSRGAMNGHDYDVIGFQRRTILVDDDTYGWNEYLLFNRERGFRYLSEYEGHWNDIVQVPSMPQPAMSGGKPGAVYQGSVFKLFQAAAATTAYVLGEFPWEVRKGDTAMVSDYVAPPLMLSAERTVEETTWSLGTYTPGARLWEAFGLEGSPPSPVGVFANQPSPYTGRVAFYWGIFALLTLLLLLVGAVRLVTAARQPVFSSSYAFRPGAPESSFVTPVFEIAGRSSNVEVAIRTDLNNNWIYFNLALINADTGDALDFGREVSYYYGTDSDGRWTEGSRKDAAVLPTVAPGHYYLRVEPETESNSRPVSYSLTVLRDVPSPLYYLIALGLLIVPPVLVTIRSASFEARRWQESDYPNDDDDD